MQFPFSLLKSVIAFDQPLIASEVSNYLTSLGMEVEKVSNPALIYKNFIYY